MNDFSSLSESFTLLVFTSRLAIKNLDQFICRSRFEISDGGKVENN